MPKRDLMIAPLCEAALLGAAAVASWLVHQPLLFSSLGPTAYELVETPERKSARPYNVVAGHLTGVISGFAALYLTHGFATPAVLTGTLSWPRVGAVLLSAALTVLMTLAIQASQPAAVATALLISTGAMQQWKDAFAIMAAVLLVLALGEPVRLWRLRDSHKRQLSV